jgi:plasmid stabilization system protein ParE
MGLSLPLPLREGIEGGSHTAAAKRLVQKVFHHVGQRADHPKSGSKPPELKGWRYRQIVEPPCRIFYRQDDARIYILYVMRAERLLRPGVLHSRERKAAK